MNTRTLILPGIGDSDQGHWQTIWQNSHPDFVRVQQRDWENAVCMEWVANLDNAVADDENVVLVAHSLGCLMVAHWAKQTHRKIRGALLVAPPSPTAATAAEIFRTMTSGFLPVPVHSFGFTSIVVASSDDPYSDLDFSHSCATAWGSHFINIGAVGHINTSSGLGEWCEGFALYQQLAAQ